MGFFRNFFDQRKREFRAGEKLTSYDQYFGGYFEEVYDINVSKGEQLIYFLETDLVYPPHLHDLLSDYPPGPEKYQVADDALSPSMQRLLNKQKHRIPKLVKTTKSGKSTSKLCITLKKKTNYVLTLRNLILLTSLGIEVTA